MNPSLIDPQAAPAQASAGGWNFADVWETIAQVQPDRIAQACGERTVSWREFDQQANGLAAWLIQAGCRHQDKVALYLYNTLEFLQSFYACLKVSLVPVNTNYRYRHDELFALWDNADASTVIFDAEFTDTIDAIRSRCVKVLRWLRVGDADNCPGWATPFAQAARPSAQNASGHHKRSGDDLILIYTGGTTGHPRGVMWRQHDLYVASNTTGDPETPDLDVVRRRVCGQDTGTGGERRPPVGLPAAPLMHGTALVFASTVLNRGGLTVTLQQRHADMEELLDTVQARGVSELCIVGDAFCRPMVDMLDTAPQRWNVDCLRAVSSSGMMWSPAIKERLVQYARNAVLVDFLNSSEASGMGRATSSRGRAGEPARFKLGRNAVVLDDNNRLMAPGSPAPGRIAVRGGVPLGYYGDPVKSAATFPVIDGVRYAIPGDYARVEADGTITLLGRGSVSINSGGEKVFPEEVEECIKLLEGVRDAVVVGLPHERFGETITAVVETVTGASVLSDDVVSHVRQRLAGHKVPRQVVFVESSQRGPNGKVDYRALRQRAQDALQAPSSHPNSGT